KDFKRFSAQTGGNEAIGIDGYFFDFTFFHDSNAFNAFFSVMPDFLRCRRKSLVTWERISSLISAGSVLVGAGNKTAAQVPCLVTRIGSFALSMAVILS